MNSQTILIIWRFLDSTVNLSSDPGDKLKIYRENFEKSYIDATESFYRVKAMQYLQENGVQNYMKYAFAKLKEEETRAKKYLEPSSGSIQAVSSSGIWQTNTKCLAYFNIWCSII